MENKRERRILSVSFPPNDKGYEYAQDKPNSSYYIRELIKNDMKNAKGKTNDMVEVDTEININDFLL